MNQIKPNRKSSSVWQSCISLGLIGASVGWLVGLSVSPVVQSVLTSLLAIASTLLLATSGLSRSDAGMLSKFSAAVVLPPAACFFVALAFSASLGVSCRTNYTFGMNPENLADRWAKTGWSDAELHRKLFQLAHQHESTPSNPGPTNPGTGAGLFNEISADECTQLKGLTSDPQVLRRRMRQSTVEDVAELELSISDDKKLIEEVMKRCQE